MYGPPDKTAYLVGSGLAATLSYPAWRLAAQRQSAFHVKAGLANALKPPYKGMLSVVGGMTWARAFILYAGDAAQTHDSLLVGASATTVASVFVQLVNQPLIRASITLQNPEAQTSGLGGTLLDIWQRQGVAGLWRGTSMGLAKTVPKYTSSVLIKHSVERNAAYVEVERHSPVTALAVKGIVAGVGGAALTNPMDVVRNQMFKTDQRCLECLAALRTTHGSSWMWRGVGANAFSAGLPVALAVFAIDLIQHHGALQ